MIALPTAFLFLASPGSQPSFTSISSTSPLYSTPSAHWIGLRLSRRRSRSRAPRSRLRRRLRSRLSSPQSSVAQRTNYYFDYPRVPQRRRSPSLRGISTDGIAWRQPVRRPPPSRCASQLFPPKGGKQPTHWRKTVATVVLRQSFNWRKPRVPASFLAVWGLLALRQSFDWRIFGGFWAGFQKGTASSSGAFPASM